MTALSDPAERVRELMERIASEAGVDASVEVNEDDDGVTAEFVGDDLGSSDRPPRPDDRRDPAPRLPHRFQGPRDVRKRVVVDAAGYRERRAVALRAAADQAAEAAVHDRRPVPLEAMSALERKVVHEHLKTRHDVETYSEGQEPARRLVVAPLVD